MSAVAKLAPAARFERLPGADTRLLLGLLPALLAIKLFWLWGDPGLRVFMGDSASYLHSALTGWVPPDRSFTYGWLVRWTAVAFRSPSALVWLQSALGIVGALLLAHLLHRRLGIGAAISAIAALLFALDPSQLLYERMMMAESAGSLALMTLVLALAIYATSGHLRWMAVATLAGVAAVSFRFSLLPVVIGLAATVPVVAALCAPRERAWPLALVQHLACAAVLTASAHYAYQWHYGQHFDGKPAYLQARGMMRIGLVAPMIRPAHFEGTGVPPSVLDEVGIDLADPRTREKQVWLPEGLYAAIARHSDHPESVARIVTARALRDDPLRLVGMGVQNLGDYFDPALLRYRLASDLGRRPPDPAMRAEMLTNLHWDYADSASADTWSTRWFSVGLPWIVGGLFALVPLATWALALAWRTPQRAPMAVVALASLGLAASILLFAHIPSLRYLHPMAFLVIANGAYLVHACRRRDEPAPPARR